MAKSLDIDCSSTEVLELQPLIMGKLAELQNCDVAKVDKDLVSYSLLLFENRNSVDAIVTELNLFFDGDNCPKFVQWLWRLLAPISEKQTRAKFSAKKEVKLESRLAERGGVRDEPKVAAKEADVADERARKKTAVKEAKDEVAKMDNEVAKESIAKDIKFQAENAGLKRVGAKMETNNSSSNATPGTKANVVKTPLEKKTLKSHISEVLNFTVAENKKLENSKLAGQSRSVRAQLAGRDDRVGKADSPPSQKMKVTSIIGKRRRGAEHEAPRFASLNKKLVDKGSSASHMDDHYDKGLTKKPRIEITFPKTKNESQSSPPNVANGQKPIIRNPVAPSSNINQIRTAFSYNSARKLKMCQFWPKCTNGSNCPYIHSDQICSYFPNCLRGSSCQYYHLSVDGGSVVSSMQMAAHQLSPTPCIFGVRCTNPACSFAHPARQTMQPVLADRSAVPCRFGAYCRNGISCPFSHGDRLISTEKDERRCGEDNSAVLKGDTNEAGEISEVESISNGDGVAISRKMAPAAERQLCRFDKKCQKIGCELWHPLRDRDLRHLVEKERNK